MRFDAAGTTIAEAVNYADAGWKPESDLACTSESHDNPIPIEYLGIFAKAGADSAKGGRPRDTDESGGQEAVRKARQNIKGAQAEAARGCPRRKTQQMARLWMATARAHQFRTC